MTPPRAQRAADRRHAGEEDLQSLLQRGREETQRLSQYVCLLERRLRLGAERADLLQIVHTIKFASEDLQTLWRSAPHAAAPAPETTEISVPAEPPHPETIALGPLVTRCFTTVRQRARRRGVFLLCDVAPDLPTLTTDPERLTQALSLLFEQVAGASGKGSLEVRVRWDAGALVIDIYDAGRGVSQDTYVALRNLVRSLQGSLVVSHELGMRSRVEFSFPPALSGANGAGRQRGGVP
jgi:signal transduction histidine kinase